MGQKLANSQLPVVAVCGLTGTGKSKLGIELAKLFNGEVINFDAIQLYNGLEVATNKVGYSFVTNVQVSNQESCCIPHHLLGVLEPDQSVKFDMRKFKSLCLPIIDQLRGSSKLPILVGGTHYYLEAILWSDFGGNSDSETKLDSLPQLPTDPVECYEQLRSLNPDKAARLHPNNTRKVKQALLRSLSSPTETTNNNHPNRSYSPRYPDNSLLLWLDCQDVGVLDQSLDRRVDQMIQRGLIHELDAFVDRIIGSSSPSQLDKGDRIVQLLNESSTSEEDEEGGNKRSDPLRRRGILQSIGFKEFAAYLALSPDERNSPDGKMLLGNAIDRVKVSTRQYARRQRKWIVNRFVKRPLEGSLPVYRLDITPLLSSTTSPQTVDDLWLTNVLGPACHAIIGHYIKSNDWSLEADFQLQAILDKTSPRQPESCWLTVDDQADLPQHWTCTVCNNRQFETKRDWEAHLASKGHRRLARKAKASQEEVAS